MSVSLDINGVTYEYPETGDNDWGPEATSWAVGVTNGMLQKAGGLFQLLAEVDFGTSFGIKSLYYKSRTANPATAGQMRLANTDVISWRNAANAANIDLTTNASDRLAYGTVVVPTISSTDTLTNKSLSGLSNTFSNIPYSALVLTGSIVNADISNSAAIAYSKLNLTGSIVNADISASAAIAFSKLATLTSGNILVGSGSNVATSVAMSGDTTISNAGVVAIGNNKVTNAMLAQVSTATFKGRTTASTGNVEDLTATQATALLNNFVGDSGSGGTKGLVKAPAAGDAAANKFLNADGTWKATAGGGDVTGPASSTDNGFVRFDGITGKLLKDSPATIVNADVDAAAAIAYSKLNLTGGIVNADVNASAAIAYSKLNLALSIVNADVSASAQIDYTKLSLGNSIVNADINASAAIAYSKLSLTGSIVNTDISGSAAIAWSKMANLTVNRALVSDSSGDVSAATTTDTEIGYINGLTNTNGGLVYGNGTGIRTTSAGTSGQWVTSAGAAAPVFGDSTSRAKTFSDTTDATSGSTGSIITAGGVGVAKSIFSGALITSTTGMKFKDTGSGSTPISWYEESSYSATVTGYGTPPSVTIKYIRIGKVVTLAIPAFTGTSNSTGLTLSLPSNLQPGAIGMDQQTVVRQITNNGSTTQPSMAFISNSGTVIDIRKDLSGGTWTNSGTKACEQFNFTYLIA